MILLTKGLTNQKIIVTLWEAVTVSNPTYVFKFTSVSLKDSEQITFNYTKANDLSNYQDRFNKFLFDQTLVTNLPAGQYRYSVTEQQTGIVLEVGKMLLKPQIIIQKNGYTTTTERNGIGN